MAYLIDTDILIYSMKGNPVVHDNFQLHMKDIKAISVISYGELIFGAKKSKESTKNMAAVRRLSEIFPIVEITKNIIEIFGELKAKLVKSGTVLDEMDLLIAASAINMNYTLVTNNEKHFSRLKVKSHMNC